MAGRLRDYLEEIDIHRDPDNLGMERNLILISIAISLKRMADILEEARNKEKRGDPFDDVDPHVER